MFGSEMTVNHCMMRQTATLYLAWKAGSVLNFVHSSVKMEESLFLST